MKNQRAAPPLYGGFGALHWPLWLLPQAMIEPSLRSPTVCWLPAAIMVKVTVAGSDGTLHWPHELLPHATTDPSLRGPTVCWRPPAIMGKVRAYGSDGTLHW